jgi:adenine/guanine phosphoribosyltransferase-like PRPP-binding protein
MQEMKIEYLGAEYFKDLLERPNSVIVRVASAVRRNFPKCTGLITIDGISGTAIIVPVALKLKLPFCIVRRGNRSHSIHGMVGQIRPRMNMVFIDDFIDTGATIRLVNKKMKSKFGDEYQTIGAVLYGCNAKKRVKDYKSEFKLPGNKKISTIELVNL